MLASQDDFDVSITGRGGHAASPHTTVDPVVIAAQVIIGLQSLVSRTVDPTESFVVSVTKMKGSEGYNVIPDRAELSGTVRALSPSLRDLAERSIERIARGISAAHGAELDFRYRRSVPVTFNEASAARSVLAAAGRAGYPVDEQIKPVMGAEDFAYMLEALPGALALLGNGDTAALHHPPYDFNDEAIPYGIQYWISLVRSALGIVDLQANS